LHASADFSRPRGGKQFPYRPGPQGANSIAPTLEEQLARIRQPRPTYRRLAATLIELRRIARHDAGVRTALRQLAACAIEEAK
jgi:hypothetical protein